MNDYRNILERESKGESKIYLYRVGDCWAGYEQSAYKLGKLLDGLSPQCHFVNNSMWLAKVEIADDVLPREHIVHSDEHECILDVPFLM